ncbi:hypothetical protein AArcSl_2533 [Halalkaliarchaeum desulfuricum]|uniref:DUF1638 domain-containing protein n=1 Tax=Halalkaliarchaeum desulfuricum TaxID=2055893 RepID=A0A343TM32_9EURY|nr:DUF1638 domain-containing protein [Halalkaliarchaeum desulfuricum]AUX10154.1 hypothetical protein AArcSl_2533 [Halalkaliarchaeum desulfuricum]
MLGIVACETLYDELGRLAPDASIEFVPQWYHEFPIHAPESQRIHDQVQESIDTLEEEGVDDILVLYHDPAGVAGVSSSEVPLFVYWGGDCIELFLIDRPRGPHGERKSAGTYYLTRGWIDVGLDCFKVYSAYAGEYDGLVRRFEEAQENHPDMWVNWPHSERVQEAATRSERMQTPPEALVRDVVSCYHHVVLLDTGNLYPFHREYAESFRQFVIGVGGDDSAAASASLSVSEADLSRLERILGEPESVREVERYDPGEPVSEPGPSPILSEPSGE